MPSIRDELAESRGVALGPAGAHPSRRGAAHRSRAWSFPTDWSPLRGPATAVRGRPSSIRHAAADRIGALARRPAALEFAGPGEKAGDLRVEPHGAPRHATIIRMSTLPPEWQRSTAVGAAKDYFFDVVAAGVLALVYAGFSDRPDRWRQGHGHREVAVGGRLEPGGVPRARDRRRDGCSSSATVRHVWPSSSRCPSSRSRFAGRIPPCRRAGSGRVPGRPPVSVRYSAPLHPMEGESHRDLSRRMTQAVARLHDEDRTTWWDSLQRSERGETPSLSGPRPSLAARGEASRPITRRGRRPTWR